MLQTIFQMISPSHCIKCNALGGLFCVRCENKCVQPPSPACYRCNKLSADFKTCRPCRSSTPIFSVHKLGLYEDWVKELIFVMKFAPNREAARLLGSRMAKQIDPEKIELITYVPTDRKRVRQRGFDHAKLIAQQVSSELDLPLVHSLSRRHSARQVGMSRADRRRQMTDMFMVRGDHHQGSRVLLVDDVLSTGATIEAAAKAIKSSGAYRVQVAVAAHNR